MAPPRNHAEEYTVIPDVENVDGGNSSVGPKNAHDLSWPRAKESDTYNLSLAFSLMSGTVWLSMFLWGLWIAAFYSMAVANRDWHSFNIIFPDMWNDKFPVASVAIAIHFIGAVFMSLAGAFQLVKYIRKHYAIVHRWVGRLYIIASIIASVGGLVFIVDKGSYGGREADIAFGIYGLYFLWCCLACYYYAAVAKDFSTHKLWAWRLYALALASWIYRADYYYWMLVFGHHGSTWLHNKATTALFDYFVNWAFYVPNLIIVEIVYRWGENRQLPGTWARILNTAYFVGWIMAIVFTVHAASQLWIPSVFGGYDEEHAWIMR